MSEERNLGGRPTKYRAEYCDKMVKFFDRTLLKQDAEKPTLNKFPTFERFAFEIGVHHETLLEWCKVNPEFSESYRTCKAIQKDLIIEGGMSGAYKEGFTKFLAVNVTDLRDKVESEVTTRQIQINIDKQDSGL